MIPYFEIPPLQLGPLTLHAFGALSALGIIVGIHLARRAVHTVGPGDERPLVEAAPWAVLFGLVGAHLAHVLLYHPYLLETEGPLVLLKVWEGISSMGGVVGGLAGFWWFLRRRGARLFDYADALALGAAPGWAVARIGCFLAHDHPGRLTDFPLAVAFPGGARHDLGLYEFVLLAALSGVLYAVARRPRPKGTLIGILAVGYSVPRFFLDFLRATDMPMSDGRIAGLTFAQYASVVLALVGVGILVRAARKGGGEQGADTKAEAAKKPSRAAA